jgi:hypothetical protein
MFPSGRKKYRPASPPLQANLSFTTLSDDFSCRKGAIPETRCCSAGKANTQLNLRRVGILDRGAAPLGLTGAAFSFVVQAFAPRSSPIFYFQFSIF